MDTLTTDIVIVALNLMYLYKESTPNLIVILNVVVYVVFVHNIYDCIVIKYIRECSQLCAV